MASESYEANKERPDLNEEAYQEAAPWRIRLRDGDDDPGPGMASHVVTSADADMSDEAATVALVEDAWADYDAGRDGVGVASRTLDFLRRYSPETYVRAIYAAHQHPLRSQTPHGVVGVSERAVESLTSDLAEAQDEMDEERKSARRFSELAAQRKTLADKLQQARDESVAERDLLRVRVGNLETTVRIREQELAAVNEALGLKAEECGAAYEKIEELKKQITILSDRVEILDRSLDEAFQARNTYRDQVEQCREDEEEKLKSVRHLEQALYYVREENSRLSDACSRYLNANLSLQQEVDTLKQVCSDAEDSNDAELEQQIEQCHDTGRRLHEAKEEYKARAQWFQDQLGLVRTERDGWIQAYYGVAGDRDDLKEQVVRLSADNEDLERAIGTLTGERDEKDRILVEKHKELEQQIEDWTAKCEWLDRSKAIRHEEYRRLNENYTALQEANDRLRVEIKRLNEESDRFSAKIVDLEDRCRCLSADCAKVVRERDLATNETEDWKAQCERLSAKITDLADERRTLVQRTRVLDAKFTTERAHGRRLQKALAQERADKANLELQVQDLSERVHVLRSTRRKLEDEVVSLERRLSAVSAPLRPDPSAPFKKA